MASDAGVVKPTSSVDFAKKDMKPGFLSGNKAEEKRDGASGSLRSAEDNAVSKSPEKSVDDLAGARENEERAGGLYTGKGKTGGEKINGRMNSKVKGFLKKKGPITGTILTIFIFGIMSFGSLSTQIVAWKENIASIFGQNSAVISRRSNYMFNRIFNENQSITTNTIFGSKFKISNKLSNKLKEQNINYVETQDANGKKLKMLVFEDADGVAIPIVARQKDVARANTLAGTEIDIDGKKVKLADSSMTLSEARVKNKNFDVSLDTATLTFTGKIAGWFDKMADSMYDRVIGNKARNQTDIDDPDEENVNKMLLGNSSEGTDDAEIVEAKKEVEEEGPDGKKKTVEVDAVDSDTIGDTDTTYGEIKEGKTKIQTDSDDIQSTRVKTEGSLSDMAKKVAMGAATIGCGFLKTVGAISVTVGAIMTINTINYASKYLEIADKIKAGEADEVTNISMNNINETVDTAAYDNNGNEVKLTGSVASSNGFNAAFSSENIIDENDPSAQMVNREYVTKNALRALGTGSIVGSIASEIAAFGGGIKAFRACNIVQFTAGVADAVADVVLLFGSAGIGNAIKSFLKVAVKGAAFAAVMAGVTIVIGLVTPVVASWLVGNLSNVFLGVNGGFALDSGAHSITDSNLQMTSGKFADKDNAVELFAMTKDVEKKWAAYERNTKSPFDLTSKYTFFGSLYNSLIPAMNTSSSNVTGVASAVGSLVGNSLVSIANDSASAASDVNDFALSLASDDNCGYLSSVGVAGDFACNKYSGAYVKEIDSVDPEEIYNNMKSYGSFDGEYDDGNPKVDPNSEYAKFIVACVTNDAQPGTMSAAVASFVDKANQGLGTVGSGIANFASTFVPGNGIIDALDSVQQESNYLWNSGIACTGKTDDAALNEKVKNFSMYNLDQRVLADMGLAEENSTVAFLEDYYKENPLDNSYEGKIARFSGLTKEEVSDTLALLEYIEFVQDYDSSSRYAFGTPEVEKSHEILFDDNNVVAEDVHGVLLNEISFADVRNRSFAV